jgi:hypothetical protein
MADSEEQTPITETPVDDIEMGDSAVGAGEETGLTKLEPEAPKLVLFAEYVTGLSSICTGIAIYTSMPRRQLSATAMR